MSSESTVDQYVTWSYPGHQAATLGEFFAHFTKIKTDESRVKALQEFIRELAGSPAKIAAIRVFVECYCLPSCKIDLPPGVPTKIERFHKLPDKVAGSIYKMTRDIGYFLPEHPRFIRQQAKREMVFMGFVENLYEADARLIVAMKDQDFSYVPGLSVDIFHQALPGWIPKPAIVKQAHPVKQKIEDVVLPAGAVSTKPAPKKAGRPKKVPLA